MTIPPVFRDFRRLNFQVLSYYFPAGAVLCFGSATGTVPPADGEEFAFLARRLGFGSRQPELAAQLAEHVQAVQQVSTRLMP